jgi:hypothetical protein
VLKHEDAAEVRIVAAAILAAAANAVLVAHHLSKLLANSVTALAHLHVRNLPQNNILVAGSTREKRGGRSEGVEEALSQQV